MKAQTTTLTGQPADSDPYGTHSPVLAAVAATVRVRRVLELGGGLHSTRLFLDTSVFPHLRVLLTAEHDPSWAEQVRTGDPRHLVLGAASPDGVAWLAQSQFDLILVDNAITMNERANTISAVSIARPKALVVIHDFEHDLYREAARFDHVAVSKRRTPWTAVAWNAGSPHGSERLHRVVAEA